MNDLVRYGIFDIVFKTIVIKILFVLILSVKNYSNDTLRCELASESEKLTTNERKWLYAIDTSIFSCAHCAECCPM